jgi:hypothetical protein
MPLVETLVPQNKQNLFFSKLIKKTIRPEKWTKDLKNA